MANLAGSPGQKPKKLPPKRDTLPPPPSLLNPSRTIPRRLVPFRHPDFTDDQIKSLTEGPLVGKDKLLNSLRRLKTATPTGLLAVNDHHSRSGEAFSPGGGVSPGGSSSDGELVSAMMARLVWLEAKLSEAHRQLQEKEKNVTHLEELIDIMKQGRCLSTAYEGSHAYELEETCLRLRNQVYQMERFLDGYGLLWPDDAQRRGSREICSLENNLSIPIKCDDQREVMIGDEGHRGGPPSPARSSSPFDDSFAVDYDLVVENIRNLNVLAGEGVPQICLSSESAKLKLVDNVPLALYSNGISLCGGPFRPFLDGDTKQCVRDLMDGYFPSELQRCYPNGVPLKVIDKRHTEFKDRRAGLSMRTLPLPESRSPSLSPVSPHTPSSPMGSFSSPGRTPDSSSANSWQLLDSLPKSVVRDGRLVDVRNSLAQLLKVNMPVLDVILVQTPVIQHIRDGVASKPITTLRIRSETGNETYLMKLYTTDTIGDVRKHLDLHRLSHVAAYNIVALYPRRVFSRVEETLEACGLVPNAALYLHQAQ